MSDHAAVEKALGYRFKDRELLSQALVHSSHAAEHIGASSNERLEFLGDAVLQLVVTEFVYATWSGLAEGELAKIRAASVSGTRLANIARELDLGPHVLLGRGEEASGGREKDSILADALEALLAAVYLDGGFEPARLVILQLWEDRIRSFAMEPGAMDFKTRLQEHLAQQGIRPRYRTVEGGLDHEKTFAATVYVRGDVLGSGKGRSKKQAEQQAAEMALGKLGV